MKPIHEQEWYLDAYGDVCRGKESLATHTNASPEEMRCMAAALDMARALLRTLGARANTGSRTRGCDAAGIVHACQSCEALSALRKAGVLP